MPSIIWPHEQKECGLVQRTKDPLGGSTDKDPLGGSTDKDAQAGSTVLVTYLRGAISKP